MDQPKGSTATRATASGGGGARDKPDKQQQQQQQQQSRKDKKEKGAKSGGSYKRNKKSKKEGPPPMTRVVIRRLPPTMTEALFCEQIAVDGKLPANDEFYFVGPDWTLGHNASCRAYINFTNQEDIFRFTDSYDGYTFVDSKGMEYQAVVEYAPFQRPQKSRSRKKDPKCGTIEADTHFIAFKEALEKEQQEALHGRGTQEFSFKIEQEEKTTTTPLLEYIAQRKQEKRDERRRKQEEKRRMREEERNMRKTQIARAIPDAIEEEAFNEFLERTALPRLSSMQNASKAGGSGGKGGADGKYKDDKDKKSRNKKDKERNREKKGEESKGPQDGEKVIIMKKQDRDKQDRDKQDRGKKVKEKQGKEETRPKEQNQQQKGGERNDKMKKDKPSTGAVGTSDQPSTPNANNAAASSSSNNNKKEVKKYSERRKETRARAETRFAEQDNSKNEPEPSTDGRPPATDQKGVDVKKTVLTANVPPFVPKEKKSGSSPSVASIPADRTDLTDKMAKLSIEKDHGNSPSPDGGAPSSGPSNSASKLTEKQREAREARKIRNKDRPSIEIYQPRSKRLVTGAGAGGKSEDDRGRSDSDRPSDNVSASASATGLATESGEGSIKERRHKLTKKASDRQQRERKNGRKGSIDADSAKEQSATVS
uniref:UPF3 domain-containing protein n=1 Tax=Anopheles epiroticus TaxID=199890 RepID=A0A182PDJ8_9DIPT